MLPGLKGCLVDLALAFVQELLHDEVWLNLTIELIRVDPYRVFAHITDVLVAEQLVDFPERLVVVLVDSAKQLLLVLLLHLRQNLVR